MRRKVMEQGAGFSVLKKRSSEEETKEVKESDQTTNVSRKG